MATAADYTVMLQGLLPPGPAWNRVPGSALTRMLSAFAAELARLDNRAQLLLEEANPATTQQMLETRYTEAGLPSPCAGRAPTPEQRRAEILYRWAAIGGASLEYWGSIIAKLGYPVSIHEFRPFRVGHSAVGDALYGDDWAYWWQVDALDAAYQHFAVGVSTVGEPLQLWGNNTLTCMLELLKPAHTAIKFNYFATPGDLEEIISFDAPTASWAGTLTNFAIVGSALHYDGPAKPWATMSLNDFIFQPALPSVYITAPHDAGSIKTCRADVVIVANGEAVVDWSSSDDGLSWSPLAPITTVLRGRLFRVRVMVTGGKQWLTGVQISLKSFS
jgi:uncharacterized protein YmfQ (DUF2313 family)